MQGHWLISPDAMNPDTVMCPDNVMRTIHVVEGMTFMKNTGRRQYPEPTRGRGRSRRGRSSGRRQTEQAVWVDNWEQATLEDVLRSAYPAGGHTHDSEISLSYDGEERNVTRLEGTRLSLPDPIYIRARCVYTDGTPGYCLGTTEVSILPELQAYYPEKPSREYRVFDWGSR